MAQEKPSYIGSLNAIANGEQGGYEVLKAFADNAQREDVAHLLRVVSIRELEHAAAFQKRLCELGFALRPSENPKLGDSLECVRSQASDCEKFEHLGLNKEPEPDAPDQLLQLLADTSIDPQTAGLLGRFIAEERDSGRLLREAYRLSKSDAPAAPREPLAEIGAQLAELTQAVNALVEREAPKKRRARRPAAT